MAYGFVVGSRFETSFIISRYRKSWAVRINGEVGNVKCEHEGFLWSTGLQDVSCSVRPATWGSLTLQGAYARFWLGSHVARGRQKFEHDVAGSRHWTVAVRRNAVSLSTKTHSGYLERRVTGFCPNPGTSTACGGSLPFLGTARHARQSRPAVGRLETRCRKVWSQVYSHSSVAVFQTNRGSLTAIRRAE